MDVSNIFLLYKGDGLPENFCSIPSVGFVDALVTVVVVANQVVLVVPSVGGLQQLQIKNNNNIIREEVVPKLNKPDANYAGIMAPKNTEALHYYKISFWSVETRGP